MQHAVSCRALPAPPGTAGSCAPYHPPLLPTELRRAPPLHPITAFPCCFTAWFCRHAFQAETKQLLDIVARSLYSDKEVFIREIVSNASDALEKLRLADLQQGADPSGSALNISVTCDDASGTLTVTDSGIGMSKEDLVQCLGTIASSGTRSLVEKLKAQGSGRQNPFSLCFPFVFNPKALFRRLRPHVPHRQVWRWLLQRFHDVRQRARDDASP